MSHFSSHLSADSVDIGAAPGDLGGRTSGERRLAARTPARFRDRVLAQFRSPENMAYLRGVFGRRVPAGALRAHVLATFEGAALEFSGGGAGDDRALEILHSDPVAQRGGRRPALGLWGEVRRLNRAFYEERLDAMRDTAYIVDPGDTRDGVADDGEQYHMRMFVADSLRPPGLEHLNTPGPLHNLREDQSTWQPAREGFAAGAASAAVGDPDVFMYGVEDAPWSSGDANRTPEQAVAEYWGDGWSSSSTAVGAPEIAGRAYGDDYSWGDRWRENGGTRAMRYESIPFWQKGGRSGIEHDIDDTLGSASLELDNHVRRWDMDRVRHPRGQEYRHYGARSGHVV